MNAEEQKQFDELQLRCSKTKYRIDFIQRCISEEMGYGKSETQSVAICYSYWEEGRLSRMKSLKDMVKKS